MESTIEEITITREDTITKLNQLSQRVFAKDVGDLELNQKRDLIMMDIGMIACECTVSGAETRTTEVRFNTNNYMGSFKLDLSNGVDYIRRVMDEIPTEEMMDRYFELKTTFYNMITVKWEGHEALLRSLIREAEKRDGISPIGRFK